jgi:hypothetical protein
MFLKSTGQRLSAWVVCILLVGLFILRRGYSADFHGVTIMSSGSEVAKVWAVGPDWGSYFQAALSWHESGLLADPNWHWVTNLWPPGMVLWHYLVLEIFGLESRIVLVEIGLTSVVWGTVLYSGIHFAESRREALTFLGGMALLFLTTPFQDWIFGQSFALPQGYAVASVLLAIALTARCSALTSNPGNRQQYRHLIFASVGVGLLLSVSALFRISSLWAVYFIAFFALVYGGFQLVNQTKRRFSQSKPVEWTSKRPSAFAVTVLLICFVPVVAVQVWTSIVSSAAHPANRSYTLTEPTLAYGQVWRTDDDLISAGGAWAVAAGTNWACRIDSEMCSRIAEAESVSARPYAGVGTYSTRDYIRLAAFAAIKNPIEYIRERAPKAWDSWAHGNHFQGLVFVATTISALTLALSSLLRKKDLASLLLICYATASTLPMLHILFASYYFFPIQISSVFYLLIRHNTIQPWRSRLAFGVPKASSY